MSLQIGVPDGYDWIALWVRTDFKKYMMRVKNIKYESDGALEVIVQCSDNAYRTIFFKGDFTLQENTMLCMSGRSRPNYIIHATDVYVLGGSGISDKDFSWELLPDALDRLPLLWNNSAKGNEDE